MFINKSLPLVIVGDRAKGTENRRKSLLLLGFMMSFCPNLFGRFYRYFFTFVGAIAVISRKIKAFLSQL